MAKLRELDQLRIGNATRGVTPELRIVAKRLSDLGRRTISRERGAVELPNHQRRRATDVLELVNDGLGERHVENTRLHATYYIPARARKHASQHLDPAVVIRLPLSSVIDSLLVLLDVVEVRLPLNDQILVDLE